MDTGSAAAFTEMGGIGVEEEFFVVDDETGLPTAGTDELVYGSEPPEILADRLDHELFKCVLETQTPQIDRLSEVEETITSVREAVVEHANAHGFGIAAAGLHPGARWRELEHAEKPRYRDQLNRIQYPQHRNTTAGVHVHVGIDDGDKAVWIANEIRWYLPIMLALSANSPYWNGFDTGLQSARAKIFEGLPNTGMPTKFDGINDYLTYERRMLESDAVGDRGALWFDVRPHTSHGTVEVRAPDGQHDPAYVLSFVEYSHALIHDLADRYEDGENGTDLRRELLDENKWRAIRHGHEASFITRDGEDVIDLGEIVDREVDRLGVSSLRRIYDRDSGAARQRKVREEGGLQALCQAVRL
ncbi:MAG: glutamate--cysteine ligase [Halobacteriales archaeon]